jgi:hypothetical protein
MSQRHPANDSLFAAYLKQIGHARFWTLPPVKMNVLASASGGNDQLATFEVDHRFLDKCNHACILSL